MSEAGPIGGLGRNAGEAWPERPVPKAQEWKS